ncbi:MAG: dihydroorotase [Thiotrichaceae bacterium]
MEKLTLIRPDDWHLHLRDGTAMHSVVAATARVFARAIIMPNLKPPITTVAQALAYREAILAALPRDSLFNPLMTLYLTDNTPIEEIIKLSETPEVVAIKYYPAGATTNSDSGVTDLRNVWQQIKILEELQIPLLIHGEVTVSSVDIFDRERCFIEYILDPLLQSFPNLRVVLEHITTRHAVEYVLASSDNLVATMTAHHLLLNRNALFTGGIRPHHYCLPVLKRENHRLALLEAAISGNPKFFLGTDSAPHAQTAKQSSCGCAGIYTAPAAIELYAEVFAQANALNKLEGFASYYGADFYRLPRNVDTITLQRQSWMMPEKLPFGDAEIIPFRAGELIDWQVVIEH